MKQYKHIIDFCYAYMSLSDEDKKKFMEIKGFDELFSPFYWEDVDLSYRIWKRNWQILYEPNSVAHHQVHGTINSNSFNPNYINLSILML